MVYGPNANQFAAGDISDDVAGFKKSLPDVMRGLSRPASEIGTWAGYLQTVSNPSIILGGGHSAVRAGQALYKQMKQEAHIRACWTLRMQEAIGMPVIVHPNIKGNNADRDAQVLREMLKWILTPKSLGELWHAVLVGYQCSVNEWKRDGAGVYCNQIVGEQPERFAFDTHGQARLMDTGVPGGEEIPFGLIIITRFMAFNRFWYGDGLLNSCYWPYLFAKYGLRFLVEFAEKFGDPILSGKFPEGTPADQVSAYLTILENVRRKGVFAVPNTWEVEMLEAQRSGTVNTHSSLIDICDTRVSKVLLGGTQILEMVGDSGGYASVEGHKGNLNQLVKADCMAMSAAINSDLIWPWAIFNGIENPPMVEIDCNPPEDLKSLAERQEIAVNMGVELTQEYICRSQNFDPPQQGETPLRSNVPGVTGMGGTQFAIPFKASERNNPPQNQDAILANGFRVSARNDGSNGRNIFAAPKGDDTPEGRAIDREMERGWFADFFVERTADTYAEIRGALRQALKGTGNFKAAKRAVAKIKSSDVFAPLIEDLLKRSALSAYGDTYDEARAQGVTIERDDDASQFAAPAVSAGIVWDWPDDPEAFAENAAEFWAEKIPLPYSEWTALEPLIKNKSFALAGIEDEYLVQHVHDSIDRAIKNGTTYTEWFDEVDGVFDAMGITRTNTYHLETVIRTNMSSAYTAARDRAEQSPAVRKAFPFRMYIAIEDKRTRPEHQAFNRTVLPIDHAWWSTHRAPNGFNCRCSDVLLTEDNARSYGGVTTRPSTEAPDNGFASNPADYFKEAA